MFSDLKNHTMFNPILLSNVNKVQTVIILMFIVHM